MDRSRHRWIDLDILPRAQKHRYRSRQRCRRRAGMSASTDTRIRTRTWADTTADKDTETDADLDLGTGKRGHTDTHTEFTDADTRPFTTPAIGAGMQACPPISVNFVAAISICRSSFSCHLLQFACTLYLIQSHPSHERRWSWSLASIARVGTRRASCGDVRVCAHAWLRVSVTAGLPKACDAYCVCTLQLNGPQLPVAGLFSPRGKTPGMQLLRTETVKRSDTPRWKSGQAEFRYRLDQHPSACLEISVMVRPVCALLGAAGGLLQVATGCSGL